MQNVNPPPASKESLANSAPYFNTLLLLKLITQSTLVRRAIIALKVRKQEQPSPTQTKRGRAIARPLHRFIESNLPGPNHRDGRESYFAAIFAGITRGVTNTRISVLSSVFAE